MKRLITLVLLLLSMQAVQAQTDATPADSTKTAAVDSSKLYGYSREMPVKVGGGPKEQRAYLERLKDPQGSGVRYTRLGSCCPYKTDSPNAIMGGGMLDRYEIIYHDANNEKRRAVIYITFYDYEQPKPLAGFTFFD
ncbi:MAG: hypothetical protein EOO15_07715 [Chitinophagaceae bacterium]|nr:MAG: hypothetical protein EOO15_07715 [Chitinophagaceae bacterium]